MVPQTNDSRPDDSEAVSHAVVEAVASARDTDPLELPPLYDAVDPDALNRLFDYEHAATSSATACIQFRMAECDVVVHRDGTVEATADPSPTARARRDAPEQALD
jgi:hypothetical protein